MYEFTISIKRSELVKDVRNETHKIGKGKVGSQVSAQAISNMQADDLGQDTRIVETSIRKSLERVVGDLSKHIQDVGNNPTDEDEFFIKFRMSRYYNPTSDGTIETGIYDFVKDKAIYDFVKLTSQREANLYDNEAEMRLLIVKRILNNKKWRTQ